ncbi:hypothetical protein ACF1A5_07530 [Streptomyces sp. NPDC014864]|uniref:hypothetical protein n=1 Tax=Streptomyces sp. NPDC014864 TaxID=3364924 RepID=UPI0036FAEBB1
MGLEHPLQFNGQTMSVGYEDLSTHFAPLLSDQGTAVAWLTDRPAGRPAASHCWTLPTQP